MDLTSMQLMIQDLPMAPCHAASIDEHKGQHPVGREGLGMLDFEDTLHADPTPILYRIPGTKWGGGDYLLGGFLTSWSSSSIESMAADQSMQPRDPVVWKIMPPAHWK